MLRKMKSTGLGWLWLPAFVLCVDQLSKSWIVEHITFGEPYPLLPIFNFTLAYNTGAAFSFLHTASGWQHFLLGGLAVIVTLIILCWLQRNSFHDYLVNIAVCLVMGGALGNAIDRLRYGYVIDFFDFHLNHWHFAIFNVADTAISLGAVMLCWHWLWQKK